VPQQELLKKVVAALNAEGIPYMLTGSIVSSLQGEPRSTHDIDILVTIPASLVERLLAAFPQPDYYLQRGDILEALDASNMFNLIDLREGDKVDFWILTDDPFDRSRFTRKKTVLVMGTPMYVSTPEDTILSKLRWAKMSGGSEKQFGDALGVCEVQWGALDLVYI
jgi:hypothetical protein